MAFSYVRIRCPLEEAMARYGRWIGAPEVEPPRLVQVTPLHCKVH